MPVYVFSHFKVVDGSEGREVQLINRKSLRSLTSQMLDLLMSHEDRQVTNGVRVEELSERYLQVHGAPLNPCEYGFLSLSELLKSMPYLVEVRKSCSLARGFLKRLHSLALISPLFFLSCTTSRATMTRLQPPAVVMARSASG